MESGEEQVPHENAVVALLQDTLMRVLSVLETMGQTGGPADILGISQTRARVQPQD